jgi:uncharacterized protein (UPF0261 family)
MAKAYVIGTCDTKGQELGYLKQLLEVAGVPSVLVDVGTKVTNKSDGSGADVSPQEVAACHPDGARAVFSDDRGAAIGAMATALAAFVTTRHDLGGVIGAGGSGGARCRSARRKCWSRPSRPATSALMSGRPTSA